MHKRSKIMLFDTPIFDSIALRKITERIEEFHIKVRYARTLCFKNYLNEVWSRADFKAPFFDWYNSQEFGKKSFNTVKRAVENL